VKRQNDLWIRRQLPAGVARLNKIQYAEVLFQFIKIPIFPEKKVRKFTFPTRFSKAIDLISFLWYNFYIIPL